MKTITFPRTNILASTGLVALSLLAAVSGPVTTVGAQAATLQSSFSTLQQQITQSINASVAKLQQSANSLNYGITVSSTQNGGLTVSTTGPDGSGSTTTIDSTGATSTVTTPKGTTATTTIDQNGYSKSVTKASGGSSSTTINQNGINKTVTTPDGTVSQLTLNSEGFTSSLNVSQALKDKLQQANQKAIDKLNALESKVESATDLQTLQQQATQYQQQLQDVAIANIQASVTKSIDSMTEVLNQLDQTAANLQTQVNQLMSCIQDGSVSTSTSSTSATVNASSTAPNCSSLNVAVNAGDDGASLDAKLSEVKSNLATIGSFLTSSVELITQLKDGNFSGTLQSFDGISSQVDIVFNLAMDAQNDLNNLSISVNK